MSSSESESVEKPRQKSSKSDHSSKKRKREESETKGSKKGGEEVQIKFEIRHCEPSECPPLIASFPLGPPPKHILNNQSEGLNFQLFTNQGDVSVDGEVDKSVAAPASASLFEDWNARWKSSSKKSTSATQVKKTELRASAPNHRIEYAGRDFGDTSIKNDAAKFAIGVFNKKTKTLQLVPTPVVYSMDQTIVGYEPKMPADLSHLSKLEQRRLRAKDVHNRRAQLAIDRMISNALTDKNTFALDVSTLNMNAADRAHANEDGQPTSRPDLPRYDLNADRPEDIYNIDDIIPPEQLPLLNREPFRKAIQDPKNIHKISSKLPMPFATAETILLSATSAKSKNQNADEKAAMMQYLYYMFLLYRVASKAKHNTIRYPGDANLDYIPRQFVMDMLAEYTEIPASHKSVEVPLYHFTKIKLDKLINCICILTLSLHNNKMAINTLANDLEMSFRDLRHYFINFGCRTWFGTEHDDTEPEKKNGEDDDMDEPASKKAKLESQGKKETIYARLSAPLRLPIKRLIRR